MGGSDGVTAKPADTHSNIVCDVMRNNKRGHGIVTQIELCAE
jgi:hypothetical protein